MADTVRCIRKEPWLYIWSRKPANGPAFGEVCEIDYVHTIAGQCPFVDRIGYRLKGYGGIFGAENFEAHGGGE